MIIKRVLNNNSVVTLDSFENEIIVTGVSIGYKKKKGELIDESIIDKTYKLENNEISRRFQEVIKVISDKYLIVTDKIMELIKNEYNIKVSDALYITLADHIDSVIERSKEGIEVQNAMLWDIKNLYSKEFEIGLKAIMWIKELSGIELDDNEAGFIAMHIVMAEINSDMQNITEVTALIQHIMKIVQESYQFDYDLNSSSYQRFVVHLKFFAVRILENSHIDDDMGELYDMFVQQHGFALAGADKVADYLNEQYRYNMNQDEKLHLMLHIKRIYNRNK